MSLRLKVMKRTDAEKFSREFRDEPFYILSIRGFTSDKPDFDEENPCIQDILYMQFADVDHFSYDSISDDDGTRIYRWARGLPDDALVVVHCRAGISRSSATAAALAYLFNDGDDEEFWQYPPFLPNGLVYRTVVEAEARDKVLDMWNKKDQKNWNQYVEAHPGICDFWPTCEAVDAKVGKDD